MPPTFLNGRITITGFTGSNVAEGDEFLNAIKIRRMLLFGGKVKL
jgi:hypothetical protein